MTLTIPSLADDKLAPAVARVHLAVGVFTGGEATLGQAAEIAEMSQADFLKELGRRGLSVHYGREEFQEDLRTIAELNRVLNDAGR